MNRTLLMVVFVCGTTVCASAQTPAPQPIPPVQSATAAPTANAALPAPAAAPVTPALLNHKIMPGSKVYVTPMDGFENYLAAALGKKKVQLIPVMDKTSQTTLLPELPSIRKQAGPRSCLWETSTLITQRASRCLIAKQVRSFTPTQWTRKALCTVNRRQRRLVRSTCKHTSKARNSFVSTGGAAHWVPLPPYLIGMHRRKIMPKTRFLSAVAQIV